MDSPDPSPVLPAVVPAPVSVPLNDARILLVIPDYQTVNETGSVKIAPMSAKEKMWLGVKESIDPFNVASAVMAAGFSQKGDQTPKYGEGWDSYGQRVGAALADFTTQNLFSVGLACVLHQDPRYYRKGPGTKIPARILYSISRLVIARQDYGGDVFNSSGIFGMVLGIAASNAYYPAASVRGEVMAARVETSLFGGVTGNLMSEFWPDIQKKFFHHKHAD